jgi:hypothetical protein
VTIAAGCRGLVVASALALLATGCASAQQPEVERVATVFEDPSGDPQERCGLLLPKALEQLEQDAGAPCGEAIGNLPLVGGEIGGTEVWGSDAQVRLGEDTVFLTRTAAGWRIAAALCTPRPTGPYDCEVEAS